MNNIVDSDHIYFTNNKYYIENIKYKINLDTSKKECSAIHQIHLK